MRGGPIQACKQRCPLNLGRVLDSTPLLINIITLGFIVLFIPTERETCRRHRSMSSTSMNSLDFIHDVDTI